MRKITSHVINPANDQISITVVDEPGAGGANHEYLISLANQWPAWKQTISFQNGPVAEFGVNGVTHEVLLAVIADRLRSFQAGPFACRENALALTKIEEAMHWLFSRTLERMQRGVEGTNQK